MKAVVLGAGPAGLAAAWALADRGESPTVFEKAGCVGGMCRTVEHRGYRFDLGGHRFFTKFDEVQALWEETLGEALLVRPRRSRILYDGALYDYPLRAGNALRNLGVATSARCLASYGRARLRRRGQERTFEEWVSNRFGDALFDRFFRTYSEKVWGIPTSEIGADWAAQRIKNLELGTAIRHALGRGGDGVTSLIEAFHYPRLGPGQMYEALADRVASAGGRIALEHEVVALEVADGRAVAVRVRGPEGEQRVVVDQVLSSIPITVLVRIAEPAAPPEVVEAARALTFRNLVAVNLVLDTPSPFPDTWIYVHDPGLKVGRIQNYKAWSPDLVPDPATSSVGMEYFCSDDEPLWAMSDAQLVAMATRELAATGLCDGSAVRDAVVFRVPRAYPVYRIGFEAPLATVVAWVRGIDGLHAMGRYGMFKYNNSDHSILTALLTVENLFGAAHDVWAINTDTAYHEVRGG